MRNHCKLCGGKLKNGVCTECGMDNRKSDDRYRHNAIQSMAAESIPAESKKKEERNSAQKQPLYKKQYRNFERKNLKAFLYSAAALVAFVAFIAPEFDSETDSEVYVETEMPEIQDIPIEDMEMETDEAFPAIEEWETELEAGLYVVGTDIPVGEYTITAPPGSVFQTYDNPQSADEYISFGRAPSGIEKIQEISLLEGMMVRVSGSGMRFFSRNAQVDNLAERIENPLTTPVKMSGTYTAGENFPAGTYDIEAVGKKEGNFSYSYEDKFHLSFWLRPMYAEENNYTSLRYRNVVLPEGTQIDTGEMTVMLIPSKGIIDEDYSAFY